MNNKKKIIIYIFLITFLLAGKLFSAQTSLTVSRFEIKDAESRIAAEEVNLHKWLEYHLNEKAADDERFAALKNTYTLTGEIVSFKIRNQRIDRKTGEILSKQFEIIYDFYIKDVFDKIIFSSEYNIYNYEFMVNKKTGEIIFTQEENVKRFTRFISEYIIGKIEIAETARQIVESAPAENISVSQEISVLPAAQSGKGTPVIYRVTSSAYYTDQKNFCSLAGLYFEKEFRKKFAGEKNFYAAPLNYKPSPGEKIYTLSFDFSKVNLESSSNNDLLILEIAVKSEAAFFGNSSYKSIEQKIIKKYEFPGVISLNTIDNRAMSFIAEDASAYLYDLFKTTIAENDTIVSPKDIPEFGVESKKKKIKKKKFPAISLRN